MPWRFVLLLLVACTSADTADSPAPWTGELYTRQAGYAGYPINCEETTTITGGTVDGSACPDCTYVFEVVPAGDACGILGDPWILGVDLADPSVIRQGGSDLDHPTLGGAWDAASLRLDFSGDVGNPDYAWPNSYSYTSEFYVEGWIELPDPAR